MKTLLCKCGNETDFWAATIVEFIVDAEGNRGEKICENTYYYCKDCDRELYMGSE